MFCENSQVETIPFLVVENHVVAPLLCSNAKLEFSTNLEKSSFSQNNLKNLLNRLLFRIIELIWYTVNIPAFAHILIIIISGRRSTNYLHQRMRQASEIS